jgi:hypothetical protein
LDISCVFLFRDNTGLQTYKKNPVKPLFLKGIT